MQFDNATTLDILTLSSMRSAILSDLRRTALLLLTMQCCPWLHKDALWVAAGERRKRGSLARQRGLCRIALFRRWSGIVRKNVKGRLNVWYSFPVWGPFVLQPGLFLCVCVTRWRHNALRVTHVIFRDLPLENSPFYLPVSIVSVTTAYRNKVVISWLISIEKLQKATKGALVER